MANHAFLEKDGLIHEVYEGDQTAQTVRQMVYDTSELIEVARLSGLPVNIIDDLRLIGRENMGARNEAAKALKEWQFNKIALFGASNHLRHVANLIIMATGRKNVKCFVSELQAKEWLKEKTS